MACNLFVEAPVEISNNENIAPTVPDVDIPVHPSPLTQVSLIRYWTLSVFIVAIKNMRKLFTCVCISSI